MQLADSYREGVFKKSNSCKKHLIYKNINLSISQQKYVCFFKTLLAICINLGTAILTFITHNLKIYSTKLFSQGFSKEKTCNQK